MPLIEQLEIYSSITRLVSDTVTKVENIYIYIFAADIYVYQALYFSLPSRKFAFPRHLKTGGTFALKNWSDLR